MLSLRALGGCGEIGRNCLTLEWNDGLIMLDCGVKRDMQNGHIGEYPLLTKHLADRLQAVFLSHAYLDHSGALPFLYHLGYKGDIYASNETINVVDSFTKKWDHFVIEQQGELPFTAQDMGALRFHPVHFGINRPEKLNLTVTCGRTGRMLGSLWFLFEINNQRVLYCSDSVRNPYLLKCDPLPTADIAIYSCADAGRHIDNKESMQALVDIIEDTTDNDGKVLLPVPSKGRATALYQALTLHCSNIPIYIDKIILDNLKLLSHKTDWAKPFSYMEQNMNIHIVQTDADRKAACENSDGAIILANDGMLTAHSGYYYLQQLGQDDANTVVITGHAAVGTPAQLLFDEAFCSAKNLNLQRIKLPFKLHLDDDDVLALNEQVQAKKVLLVHTEKEFARDLLQRLRQNHIEAICPSVKDSWELA